MKTFNQELKSALLAEIIKHREQDRVVQGTYGEGIGENFRGCAVGCAINSLLTVTGKHYDVRDHLTYEKELGIPTVLGELQDVIHEGLSDKDFPTWPERFMAAVPTETDLSLVFTKFVLWLLGDEVYGLPHKAETNREAIEAAVSLCDNKLNGEIVSNEAWIALSAARNCSTFYLCQVFGNIRETRTNIDRALRRHFYSSPVQEAEEYYKLCSDKLIELLKAEGKNGI